MKKCLLLIDLQNDYFPGGKMELVDTEKAAANAQLLLKKFRKEDLPIIHIQHLATQPGAAFFLPNTHGSEINEIVAPLESETVVVKNYPNSFRGTELQELLSKDEICNLIFCGAMSHMCIDATIRSAFDLGFNCVVAEDACATIDLTFQGQTIKAAEVHGAFMAALSAPYANVLTTDEILQS